MKKIKSFILVLLVVSFVFPNISAFAKEVSSVESSKTSAIYYDNTNSKYQYRFVTKVYKETWTDWQDLDSQPKKGTYLQKDDGMFYYDNNKGAKATLSFSVKLGGVASAGISIPLGQVTKSSSYGVLKRASSNGYYKLQVKKLVKATIKLKQTRSLGSNNKWSSWKTTVYSKSYDTIQVNSRLKKQ